MDRRFHQIKSIHQILIVDGGGLPASLPNEIVSNISSVRNIYPSAKYQLWCGNDIRVFISENFDAEVLNLYDNLSPYAYKADLARYCILKVLGGLYVDLGVKMMAKWDIPVRKGIAAFKDVPFNTRSWTAIQNGLLWAEPGRLEFDQAISDMCHNFRLRYYGRDTLYPSGPVLLGRAFCKTMIRKDRDIDVDDQHVGSCRCISPDSDMRNVAYVSKELIFVALRTKIIGGDMTHLGLNETNNYNILWHQRRIYGETTSVWSYKDHAIETGELALKTSEGIAAKPHAEGLVTYGPYVPLEAGKYNLKIKFLHGTSFKHFGIEIACSHGEVVLSRHIINSLSKDYMAQIEFDLESDVDLVEFKTYAYGDFEGGVYDFELSHPQGPLDFYEDVSTGNKWEWSYKSDSLKTVGKVKKTSRGILIDRKTVGRVTYGPYVHLPAGKYRLITIFSADTVFSEVIVDVSTGGNSFTEVPINNIHGRKIRFGVGDFELTMDSSNVELRLQVKDDFDGFFVGYKLIRI